MQTPQKQPDIGVSSLSTLSLDPHRELKTLLYRFLSHPETDQRKALETHLAQNATTYLENPAMSRKTASLIGDFVQHPANQQEGNVPPTLHGLDQFNQAFQEIRHAVRPLSNQTEQRLTSGFQKLDRTVNSLAAGTFGPHSEQTIKKAALNSVKIAYNITHQGIEAATMRQHINPKNDTAAKKSAQAQQCLKEAREKFHRALEKVLKLAVKTSQEVAGIAINLVPGGQVVGVTKTLTTATGGLVKAGQTIQTAQKSAKTLNTALNGAKKAVSPADPNNKSGPLQTAERIAQAGAQIDAGAKRMNHKSPEQVRHAEELKALPRII